jgi:hypothetical protein
VMIVSVAGAVLLGDVGGNRVDWKGDGITEVV